MSEVIVYHEAAVVEHRNDVQFGRQEIELIKRMCEAGNEPLTDVELQIFIHAAQRKGLDPLINQVYARKQQGKMTVQTGIDGYRLIADRTGLYDGPDGPYWCGADGEWKDVWLSNEPPSAAKFTVYKKNTTRPFTAIANWDAYAQRKRDGDLNTFWNTKGPLMLAKCAEALALRMAFPAELSGIYTDDEMAQASNGAPAKTNGVTQAQMKKVQVLFNEAGITDRTERLTLCSTVIGREITSANDLTKDEAGRLIEYLENVPKDEADNA